MLENQCDVVSQATRFLNELAKFAPQDQRVIVFQPARANTLEGEDRRNKEWGGEPWNKHRALNPNANLYTCVSAYGRNTSGKFARSPEGLGAGLAFMVDDIGTGKGSKGGMSLAELRAICEPTAIIETSPGNHQCVYFFEAAQTDAERFEAFTVGYSEHVAKVHGGDTTIRDVSRLFRLPGGVNNKRLDDGTLKYADENGKPWRVRLVSADYSRRYSIDALAEAFGFPIIVREKAPPRAADDIDAIIYNKAVAIYESAGVRARQPGKYRIECPWDDEHGSHAGGDDATFWGPDARGMKNPYGFTCGHQTCKDNNRTWFQFRDRIMDETEDSVIANLKAANEYWAKMSAEDEALSIAPLIKQAKLDADAAIARAKEHAKRAASSEGSDGNANETAGSVDSGDKAAGAAGAAKKKTGWSEGWCYMIDNDRVIRRGEFEAYSKQGFNAVFARRVENGTPFNYVQKYAGFTQVNSAAYAAGWPDVYEYKGRKFKNLFDPKSVPSAAAEYTVEGWAAVETIRYHIRLLCGFREEVARMLESWMALVVRQPGKIIGFAPIIKGIEGDGKTILMSDLMRPMIGAANHGVINSKEIASDFNAWASGRAYRVIEELKASGENRHMMVDTLKEPITNADVRVVGKGANGIEIPNTTNYAALTNHEDALPISNESRRWMVIVTPFKKIQDLEAIVGPQHAYFDRLADAIKSHWSEAKKYFMEIELFEGFKHGMRAPITADREIMIKAEQNKYGGDMFDAYLDCEFGVGSKAIAVDMLTKYFMRDLPAERPKTTQMQRLLEAKGFVKVPKVIKWLGKARNVYVSDASILEMGDLMQGEVRKLLDSTIPKGRGGEDVEMEVDLAAKGKGF